MHRPTLPLPLLALVSSFAVPVVSSAQERLPIQDNSFLLEDAYNQEPGVIQHISFFSRDRDTGESVYTFTEEWPARGQAHQLSVTVQALGLKDAAADRRAGVGDTALNYR